MITTNRSVDPIRSLPTTKDPSPKGTFERSGGTQMKTG